MSFPFPSPNHSPAKAKKPLPPAPIDLARLLLARQHHNGERARRASVDLARRSYYAAHRTARLSHLGTTTAA